MTATVPGATPIPFAPAYEQIPDDEAATGQALVEAMQQILQTTYADYGRPVRSVHAKAHGLLQGTLEVFDHLPPVLAQGAFAKPGRLPVLMRLSTNPGDLLDDRVSTPRGMALKIIGVEGERLPGSEGDVTQDFVMQNATVFTAANPKAFLKNLQLLAKTTDRLPGSKRVLSAALRGVEAVVEAAGGESGTLKSLGGHPLTHILGERFNTVVPLLYGPYYGKLSVVPVSEELTRLAGQKVDFHDRPDGLREEVQAFFAEHDGTWEVRVQLATHAEHMPIEDATVEWPQALSPYVAVARLHVPRQASWSPEKVQAIDENLAFSPWHGLAAHRPLGGIMRVRKAAYEHSAGFRGQHQGCPIHEPRA